MDANEQQLNTLASCLQQTLSMDVSTRQQAETFLRSIENNAGFLVLLLKLFDSPSLDMQIRMAAAILFKNCVKRNWRQVEGSPDVINEPDRLTVKAYIVDLMLKLPPPIQKQLSESLTMIVDNDFPHKWENLLEELVKRMNTRDFSVINGVLQTAHSIFKR
jgi:exportin-2 (importin alpha re-exporter)